MAKINKESIVRELQAGAFLLAIDGSNDTDCKPNPIVVTYYCSSDKKIKSDALAVPNLQDKSTGENKRGKSCLWA